MVAAHGVCSSGSSTGQIEVPTWAFFSSPKNPTRLSLQLAVEQVGLGADLVAGQHFGIEADRLAGEERPRVGAAALETGRDARIEHHCVVEAIVERRAPVPPAALVKRHEPGQRPRRAGALDRADRVEIGLIVPVRVEPEVVILLALLGVAEPAVEGQAGNDLPVDVGETGHRVGRGLIGLDELQREQADPGRDLDVAQVLVRNSSWSAA